MQMMYFQRIQYVYVSAASRWCSGLSSPVLMRRVRVQSPDLQVQLLMVGIWNMLQHLNMSCHAVWCGTVLFCADRQQSLSRLLDTPAGVGALSCSQHYL